MTEERQARTDTEEAARWRRVFRVAYRWALVLNQQVSALSREPSLGSPEKGSGTAKPCRLKGQQRPRSEREHAPGVARSAPHPGADGDV